MGERRVIVVGYDAAELLDIACVTTTLVMANTQGADPLYRIGVVTPGGLPIVCGTGLTLQAGEALERVTGPLDTLVVSGGIGHRAAAGNRLIVGHVRRLARESRRVASVCTGADVLAATGLLDGRRATTHWRWADAIAARHPGVTVDPGPAVPETPRADPGPVRAPVPHRGRRAPAGLHLAAHERRGEPLRVPDDRDAASGVRRPVRDPALALPLHRLHHALRPGGALVIRAGRRPSWPANRALEAAGDAGDGTPPSVRSVLGLPDRHGAKYAPGWPPLDDPSSPGSRGSPPEQWRGVGGPVIRWAVIVAFMECFAAWRTRR